MDKSCLELPQTSHCTIPKGINMASQVTTEGGDQETNRERERERDGGIGQEESSDAVYPSVCKSTCRGTVRIMSLLIIPKNVRYVNEVRI